jgi:hypothetical protein
MEVDPQAGPSTAAAEDGKGKGKADSGVKAFELKKWDAVAMWSWAITTDTCAICRNNLYEPSIEYQVSNNVGAAPAPRGHGPSTNAAAAAVCAGKPHRRPRPPRPEHSLGLMHACVPLGLHPALAEDALGVPAV